jgi:hypothetical protein
MEKLLLTFILPILLLGCSSGLKKTSLFYNDSSKYDIICEDLSTAKKFTYFLDVKVVTHSLQSIEVQQSSGKRIRLKSANCILERSSRIKEKPDGLSEQDYLETTCKLSDLKFTNTNLQLIDQDSSFNYLRKSDGKVWVLPKVRCPLDEQTISVGDQ